MTSRKNRKRPWEDDYPIGLARERRLSSFIGQRTSPPPPDVFDPQGVLDLIRLPPVCIPVCGTTAGTIDSSPDKFPSLLWEASPPGIPRARSQSLVHVAATSYWQGRDHNFEGNTSDRAIPREEMILNQSRYTTLNKPERTESRAASTKSVICCASDCLGETCSYARHTVGQLTADLALLDTNIKIITDTQHLFFAQASKLSHHSTVETLNCALNLVQWFNGTLNAYREQRSSSTLSRAPSEAQCNELDKMRRGQQHLEEREEQSPPGRQHSAQHAFPGYPQPEISPEHSQRSPYGNEIGSSARSPQRTLDSSTTSYMPSISPMQAPQPIRSIMLPSPSSLSHTNTQSLPPPSPPMFSMHAAAQSTHLQDLQHQISVKTLALSTLQHEYDSLLKKLERQQTKCATFEKKFQVSDVEINNLTDEKEKLQAQVAALESHAEELQQGRDEARRQLVTNGAQYMRILEMASRLQAQGAEDKKKWEGEKTDLEQRIRLLEEAMLAGTVQPTPRAEAGTSAAPDPFPISKTSPVVSSSQIETINVLRAEVGRLRSRTQTLETAVQTMRQESSSIQTAAEQLLGSSKRLEDAAKRTAG
ncbi:hypothetical protein ACN47E_000437 [Coniothyrium glycines]